MDRPSVSTPATPATPAFSTPARLEAPFSIVKFKHQVDQLCKHDIVGSKSTLYEQVGSFKVIEWARSIVQDPKYHDPLEVLRVFVLHGPELGNGQTLSRTALRARVDQQ